MKFNTKALAQAARDALSADRQWHEKARREETESELRARESWQQRSAERWSTCARLIARKIRNEQPILKADLPLREGSWNDSLDYYTPSQVRPAYEPAIPLVSLIVALEAVADDTVTGPALRDLGVTTDTLRRCVQYLGKSSLKS